MMRVQPQASHYVDGAYVDSVQGETLEVTYPATQEIIARLHCATPDLIDTTVSCAREAQIGWAKTPPVERGRVLCRAAAMIRAKNRELSMLETLDTGKPLQETLVADAASGADALEFFGGLIAAQTGEYIPLGDDFAYTVREPLGVCVGIGAWNYPTQIACWKAAPALACGNAMILKPSELTPLGALKLAEILTEAGLPPGVFNVLQGAGDVGAALVTHGGVDKVSLTGSVPTGQKVYAAAAAGIKHVTMELGGKSPLIVFDDANVDDAVGAAMLANFYSSGQVCSNGTRVFVQKGIKAAFLERLAARSDAIVLGDPMDEATQMGPLISKAQFDKVLAYIDIGKNEGARLVCGGAAGEGLFVKPTVFTDVTDAMRIAVEEIFGPVMSVLDFDTEDDVVARANASAFGLAAGVFTKELTRAHRVVAELHAGTCWINTYNLTPVQMPFGGVKMSGVGRENGRAALDHYSQIKSVYVATGAVDAPY